MTVTCKLGTVEDTLKKKKKLTRDQRLLCTIAIETSDIHRFYYYSYFFLTGNDLGVIGFFSRKS